MKRFILLSHALLACVIIIAQPSWTKKTAKSLFTLKTFNADGSLIGNSYGFFISTDGKAISCFTPFKGASKAVIIDAQGKESPVECIIGADDTYDVAKFQVSIKRSIPVPVSTSAADNGAKIWIQPYSVKKSLPATGGSVSRKETFMTGHTYYTLSVDAPENSAGLPALNDNGEAIGVIQADNSKSGTGFAVDAGFAAGMAVNGLSINDATLKSTLIKTALPDSLDQAILTMYVASSMPDTAKYKEIISDFIAKFPQAPDGYMSRAQMEANTDNFDDAAKDMEKALELAEKKDNVHYNYAQMIFRKELTKSEIPYRKWSLDMAAEQAEKAFSINPIPVYRQLKGEILFTRKKYDEAYNIYKQLIDSGTKTAEMYYEASQCKLMLKDSTAMLALLDSAVNTFSKPYLKNAAPYILARAQANIEAGNYRPAVYDLNEYEKLMKTKVNDRFYYIRHQAEIGGRMFQQALSDITTAIAMAPDNTVYYADKASLEIRVGMYDEAAATAAKSIAANASESDGYLFLGLAQCLKGNKEEGIKNLIKAKELGDTQAQGLIEKYSK
ncbi:tetratricopeptide repeat protein [Xylanibacter muris]|uniref:RING-type E3 ubiquitin transferase n=1 Tax=Xylanibacter muris TaxID=2736290 RepID=A0ABX2ANM6_9BACT|nr:tetratricopeptide repeat protein [Xylanibacter muris]NPD92828.1 serine protease [Xylanibacter muris]